MKLHLLIALIVGSIWSIISQFEFFKQIKEIDTFTNCKYLQQEIPGAEDVVQYQNHLIFASGNLGELFGKGNPQLKQASFYILLSDKNNENQQKVSKMKLLNFPKNIAFNPHGLYMQNKNEKYYLYAVNHAYKYGGERIEMFQIVKNDTIQYLNTILFDKEYTGTLKDLIVISDNRFLITKLMPYVDPLEGRKEWTIWDNLKNLIILILKQQTTYILDCKFELEDDNYLAQCNEVQTQKFAWAGGITWDQKDKIWVGDNLKKTVYEFQLTETTLIYQNQTIFPHQIDNIHYNKDRQSLLIAMIPKAYEQIKLNLYLKNNILSRKEQYKMWSAVGEYSLITQQMEIIYQTNESMRGISGGILINDTLYLTSWADVSPMICKKR